jgi:fused signal recognition particle receptor
MSSLFFWRKKREEETAAQAGGLTQNSEQPGSDENLTPASLPVRSSKRGIRSLFATTKFDSSDLQSLEDTLLQADFGLAASERIVAEVKQLAKLQGATTDTELKQILAHVIESQLASASRELNLSNGKLPYVFLIVGVNGAGKTTTIGKLSNWLTEGSWSVVLGAADTFRAAAVSQLATWAERSGAKLIGPKSDGQDPASVAFEAVESAIAENADIVIIDTAGRLQNKTDLMDELSKIRRVIEKRAEISEVLLVIDATTGQNGLAQAKAFSEVAQVTGIVLTKLDGTAKGGIAFAIQSELGIPIKLVGVGEGINDFAFFDPKEFASGLVA